MVILTTIISFLTHPYAVPLWAAVSVMIPHFYNIWVTKSRNKLESKKVDVAEFKASKEETRSDFQAITDALYKELERVKATQELTNRQLEEANDETKKCEQRYFELATQYRDLLKYCASLAREVRELNLKLQKHVTKENNNNEQTRTDRETDRSSTT